MTKDSRCPRCNKTFAPNSRPEPPYECPSCGQFVPEIAGMTDGGDDR